MAKAKRATWWKMFHHQRAVVDSVSDEDVGKGLKAAFRYFDGEEIPADLTGAAFTVFCVMRPYIDEAQSDYMSRVEDGRRGSEIRWNGSPPIGCDTHPKDASGYDGEAEADAETRSKKQETDAEAFSPAPTVEDVAAYCTEEKIKNVNPEQFHAYYSAKGWKTGGDEVKDWKALVKAWSANASGKDRTQKRVTTFWDIGEGKRRSPAYMSSGKQEPLSLEEWDGVMDSI